VLRCHVCRTSDRCDQLLVGTTGGANAQLALHLVMPAAATTCSELPGQAAEMPQHR
jgi:hypothetical protein